MKIDNEYATCNMDEFLYLKTMGVRYTFVKVDDNNITWYKYKKTPRLFECLKNFYMNTQYF